MRNLPSALYNLDSFLSYGLSILVSRNHISKIILAEIMLPKTMLGETMLMENLVVETTFVAPLLAETMSH